METFVVVQLMAEVIGRLVDTPDYEVVWCT